MTTNGHKGDASAGRADGALATSADADARSSLLAGDVAARLSSTGAIARHLAAALDADPRLALAHHNCATRLLMESRVASADLDGERLASVQRAVRHTLSADPLFAGECPLLSFSFSFVASSLCAYSALDRLLHLFVCASRFRRLGDPRRADARRR